jgi:hypothetical protein
MEAGGRIAGAPSGARCSPPGIVTAARSRATRRARELTQAARRLLPILMWAALPTLLTAVTFASPARLVHFAGDFHYAFWPAGHRVLHGLSPYVDPSSPAVTHATAFVYPAVAALLLAPFALIPHGAADVTFAVLNITASLLTLRVLEVRDWRLYGLVMLCPAVYSGWTLANITLLLALGIAVAWRYRERPAVVGALSALLVSAKLFLWPLALWLLATRRYAALAYAALFTLAVNLLAWAVLGFDEVGRYTRLLHALSVAEQDRGYSLSVLAHRLGIDRTGAYALTLGLATAVAIACIALGRRGQDRQALVLAVAASLLATPIVQLHYFALLALPLALARPRLSLAWSLPLLMWVCASAKPLPWQIAVALVLGCWMVAITARAGLPLPARTARARLSRRSGRSAELDLRLASPSDSSVVVRGTGA